jgi:predicted metalloendopeptidase
MYDPCAMAAAQPRRVRRRANVAATNVDGLYEAFAVQPRDRMFVPPAQRVRVW